VFVNLLTCYGKSLVYQAVPIMADVQSLPWKAILTKMSEHQTF
jgi:hypothetical protein